MTKRESGQAERAAHHALAPYVEARVLTPSQADRFMHTCTGLRLMERLARANLASGFGSTWHHGARVRDARSEWKNTRQQGAGPARQARDNLVREEAARSLYLALRCNYKTPDQIEDEDRYASLFVDARHWLDVLTEDDRARQAADHCTAREARWAEMFTLRGRVITRVRCECGGRHWDTVDLGPGVPLEEVGRFDYTILGPSKILRNLGVSITGKFVPVPPQEGQAWRLRAEARSVPAPDVSESHDPCEERQVPLTPSLAA